MKNILGMAAAIAFVFAAQAVFAQAATAPAEKATAPAVQKVEAAPTAAKPTVDPKADVTALCKKKGLAGVALDECVRNELAKTEKPAAPQVAKTAEPVKTPAAAAPAKAPKEAAVPAAPVVKPAEAPKPAVK